MNIVVVLKETFDTEEKIIIDNGQINEESAEFILNPYDEYAVEEAIKLKEEHGGEVIAVTVGQSRAESILRTALAMGADKAIIVDDECLNGDEFIISKVLSEVIKRNPFDVILAGNMSVDYGSGQIGPRLAEELGIAHVSAITKLIIEGSKAIITSDVEGNSEIIECAFPLLVTAQQGLNEPRYPSLPMIMKAKKKTIERLGLADFEFDFTAIQEKTLIIDQYLPPAKEEGRILSGELGSQIKELVSILNDKEKVI